MKQTPTSTQLEDGVSRICKVIGQIPCFHLYEEHVANRFATGEIEVSLRAMMHNAAMDSALLNLRCFNEFFKRGSKLDDLRSYHFPDLKMGVFLTLEEEQAISKFLAHLTTTGSNIATKPWFLDDMTIRGLQHGIKFLSFIATRFPLPSETARLEVRRLRETVQRVVLSIVKRASQEDTSSAG